MKNYKKTLLAFSIFPQFLLVKWLGYYPEYITQYYSNGLYHYIASGFRWVFGWIPFSAGDLFYTIAGILVIRFLWRKGRTCIKTPFLFLREVLIVCAMIYFAFHFFWGMNYYREPIHKTLHINTTYTPEMLVEFTERLIRKTNSIHLAITKNDTIPVRIPYSVKTIFRMSADGFQHIEDKMPTFIAPLHPISIKTSLYSTVLTYMGYSGYLNPFTHEAQVNRLLPGFKLPMISCHEEAHQLGYAAENEANLIGYLAAVYHPDMYFKYSGYSYGLKYCLRALRQQSNDDFNKLYGRINTGILKNYMETEKFWGAYQNDAEVVFKNSFDTFLKINNQAEGIKSYSYIVPLLIHLYRDGSL